MKKINYLMTGMLFLLAGFVEARAQSPKTEYLYEGDKLTEYPKVEWLKGEPVTTFDKDKIYIVELWATWCVPCLAAMPHLQELHRKFKDKNVVFIGQSVMEGDKAKVEQFVKRKGESLSYRIAFSGTEGTDFDKKWIKPAGVNGIPRTFVIQNNTLVWLTSPHMLNERVLQLLVDKKFSIAAAEEK